MLTYKRNKIRMLYGFCMIIEGGRQMKRKLVIAFMTLIVAALSKRGSDGGDSGDVRAFARRWANEKEVSVMTAPAIMFDKIVTALDARDAEAFKGLFSPNALKNARLFEDKEDVTKSFLYSISMFDLPSASRNDERSNGVLAKSEGLCQTEMLYPDAPRSRPEIDEQIKDLMEIYKGAFVSNSSFGSGGGSKNVEAGIITYLTISPHVKELKTDEAVYELSFFRWPPMKQTLTTSVCGA